jgi:hypothetical protein
LVGRLPGDRRGRLDRAVLLVEDSRPLDGDLAEDRLEGEGPCPPPLNAGIGFAVPPLEDQFVIGLLDEDLEEPPLEFEAGLMDVGLDLVGRCSSWGGMGKVICSDSSRERTWSVRWTGLQAMVVWRSLVSRTANLHTATMGVHRACFHRSACPSHSPS